MINTTTVVIIIILVLVCMVFITAQIYALIMRKDDMTLDELEQPQPMIFKQLSFDDCETIITAIIDDIYKNKYFLHYRLRDLCIIPEMDDEIAKITKEVMSSISPILLKSIYCYYTEDYLILSITRRVQALLVQYTDTYKPSSK